MTYPITASVIEHSIEDFLLMSAAMPCLKCISC